MSKLSFMERLLGGVEVEWKTLKEVTFPTNNIKWREESRNYRYIDLTSVGIESKTIIETTEITPSKAPSRAQKLVEENDVIFATTRPTQQRYCLIDKEYSGEVASTGYCVLRAKKDEVLPKWILYWIASADFKAYLEEHQSGSAYPAISDGKVKDFKIPIPCPEIPEKSLEIQAEIVRILDTFTTMTVELTAELNTRQKQYNHYRDKLLSFEEGEVEWKALGEIAGIQRGKRLIKSQLDKVGNYAVYQNSMTPLGYYHEYNVDGDTTFVICAGAAGAIGYSNVDFWAADDVSFLAVDRNRMNSRFLFHSLLAQQTRILSQVRRASIPRLSKAALERITVPVPSLVKQARIVAILDKFDTLTKSLTEGLPREIELRQKQYEYYRDLLLSFPKHEAKEAVGEAVLNG